jgi:hypothetical protein
MLKTSYLCFVFDDGTILWDDRFLRPFDGHEVIFLEAIGASISDAIRIHDCLQEDFESMTLLVPDRDRENQEDFIWCLPVERQKWNKWFSLSEKFKGITPPMHGGIRYVNRVEDKEVKTVLVMPTDGQTDEDVVHACAFLRMTKGISCRMYVIRCTDDPMSSAQMINKVMGTNPRDVEHIEDEDLEGQEETPKHP